MDDVRGTSETDTEVLAHLIEDFLTDDLPAAVRAALARVEGSYAIGVFWAGAPQTLVAARNHSPLVLGLDAEASYMASDIPALLPYTHQVIFLDDLEMAVLNPGAIAYQSVTDGRPIRKQVLRLVNAIVGVTDAIAEERGRAAGPEQVDVEEDLDEALERIIHRSDAT